jgi:hypothetical protein
MSIPRRMLERAVPHISRRALTASASIGFTAIAANRCGSSSVAGFSISEASASMAASAAAARRRSRVWKRNSRTT